MECDELQQNFIQLEQDKLVLEDTVNALRIELEDAEAELRRLNGFRAVVNSPADIEAAHRAAR